MKTGMYGCKPGQRPTPYQAAWARMARATPTRVTVLPQRALAPLEAVADVEPAAATAVGVTFVDPVVVTGGWVVWAWFAVR